MISRIRRQEGLYHSLADTSSRGVQSSSPAATWNLQHASIYRVPLNQHIFDRIVRYLDKATLSSVRLSCRALSPYVEDRLFARIYLEPRSDCFDRIKWISTTKQNEALWKKVRSVQVEVSFYPQLPAEQWMPWIGDSRKGGFEEESYDYDDEEQHTLSSDNDYCQMLAALGDSSTHAELLSYLHAYDARCEQQNWVAKLSPEYMYRWIWNAFGWFPNLHTVDYWCMQKSKFYSDVLRGDNGELVLRKSQFETLITPSASTNIPAWLVDFAAVSLRAITNVQWSLERILLNGMTTSVLKALVMNIPSVYADLGAVAKIGFTRLRGVKILRMDLNIGSRDKFDAFGEWRRDDRPAADKAMQMLMQSARDLTHFEYRVYDQITFDRCSTFSPNTRHSLLSRSRFRLRSFDLKGIELKPEVFMGAVVDLSGTLRDISLREVKLSENDGVYWPDIFGWLRETCLSLTTFTLQGRLWDDAGLWTAELEVWALPDEDLIDECFLDRVYDYAVRRSDDRPYTASASVFGSTEEQQIELAACWEAESDASLDFASRATLANTWELV